MALADKNKDGIPKNVLWSARLKGLLLALMFFALIADVFAVLVPLEKIGTNNIRSADLSQLDLYVVLTENDGLVRIDFYNNSTIRSSIEGLYFEAGVLAGIVNFDLGEGTYFQIDSNPDDLPHSNDLENPFITAFSADTASKVNTNGINPGQNAAVEFELVDQATFEDLLTMLYDGTWRIGVHVSGLPANADISAISIVPEPATFVLLGIGCLMFAQKTRRRS